jgi:2'-hydroxyisoflavone reductase
MPTTRRDFLRVSAAAGGALGFGLLPASAMPAPPPPPRALRILILGGTSFIGPPQVQYALDRGHSVTLFNRGRTNPQLFPQAEKLIGDRATGDLASLRGRTWDAVIDNSATNPDWVRDTAQLLKDSAGQYVFISTRSVYRDLSRVPATVDAPVFTRENTPLREGQALPYGLAKALAEGEARRAFGERATIVRPGLIVGPGDDTDRFTYWPVRIERGGDVLAPGDGSDRVQIIDARDLSEWVVRLVEQKTFGTFMGVGPRNGRSMAELLYGIAAVTTSDLQWTWVPRDFLARHRVREYAEMPVWRASIGNYAGFARFDLSREIAAGLTFRSLADTALATLAFHHSRPAERKAALRAGLAAEREREVLLAWNSATK